MRTLAEVSKTFDFSVLEHLEADAEVPVNGGLQAQGDLFIVPQPNRELLSAHDLLPGGLQLVGAAGVAVIEGVNGGHEHRLFAGEPGTAYWQPAGSGRQDIGVLECTAPAYILHPEHGATGIAPGSYVLRRQREQADEERLVAD